MENTLQSWLDEILSNDNNAKTALEMMDVFALAKGIPGEVAAFLFGIRPAGAIGRSNAETNLDEFDHLAWGFPKGVFDERRMLFYVCANWKSDDAAAWLEKAEAKEPGIIKSCVDPLGRNLLWYTLYSENYNWLHENLVNPLVKYGCDPDAETVWGLSWRDMREVR